MLQDSAPLTATRVPLGADRLAPAEYRDPKPSRLLMRLATPLNRYLLLQGLPLLRCVPLLRHIPGIGGIARVSSLDFPQREIDSLRAVINPSTAAFVCPNHPEFFSDWLVDKEIETRVAPGIASWADQDIMNGSLGWFWLRQNLIGSRGGKCAQRYSHRSALSGKGVLMHPEGQVHWTSDYIHSLCPGAATMAVHCARAAEETDRRPVYIAPIVWKYRFTGDISRALHHELTQIETRLSLNSTKGKSLGKRFFAMQIALLEKQEKHFGIEHGEAVTESIFFRRQEAMVERLLGELRDEYRTPHGSFLQQMYHIEKAARVRKTSQPGRYRRDMEKLRELRRLNGFSREVYNRPFLRQEHIAESLKRIKRDQFLGRRFDALRKSFPLPLGHRTVHIRAVPPLDIRVAIRESSTSGEELEQTILKELQRRMQQRLDALNAEIEPELKGKAIENLFYRRSHDRKKFSLLRIE